MVSKVAKYCTFSTSRWKGKKNGDRTYLMHLGGTTAPLGTYHLIDNVRVRINYRNCVPTCVGGGFAKRCAEGGGPKINVDEHIKWLAAEHQRRLAKKHDSPDKVTNESRDIMNNNASSEELTSVDIPGQVPTKSSIESFKFIQPTIPSLMSGKMLRVVRDNPASEVEQTPPPPTNKETDHQNEKPKPVVPAPHHPKVHPKPVLHNQNMILHTETKELEKEKDNSKIEIENYESPSIPLDTEKDKSPDLIENNLKEQTELDESASASPNTKKEISTDLKIFPSISFSEINAREKSSNLTPVHNLTSPSDPTSEEETEVNEMSSDTVHDSAAQPTAPVLTPTTPEEDNTLFLTPKDQQSPTKKSPRKLQTKMCPYSKTKKTPPRKDIVKSIAARRIDGLLQNKSLEAKETEWIQNLPDTCPAYKSVLAQRILKQSASKNSEGSILRYMRKRKKSPGGLTQNKAIKQEEYFSDLSKKQLLFSPNSEDNSPKPQDTPNENSPKPKDTNTDNEDIDPPVNVSEKDTPTTE